MLKAEIDKEVIVNQKNVQSLEKVNAGLDMVEESKKKGSSAKIELKKLQKWNTNKEQELLELKQQKLQIENKQKEIEQLIKGHESKLSSIHNIHKKNCKKFVKK